MAFSEEVAWVTGSSTGIGRAVAEALAREGRRVAGHYNASEEEARGGAEGTSAAGGAAALAGVGGGAAHYNAREEEARGVAEGIASAGGEAMLVGGDVSDAGEVDRMVGEIEDRYGRLDGLGHHPRPPPARPTPP